MRDEDSQIGEQFEAFIKRQAPELVVQDDLVGG